MSLLQAVVSLVAQTTESICHAAEYKNADMLVCKVSNAMVIIGSAVAS